MSMPFPSTEEEVGRQQVPISRKMRRRLKRVQKDYVEVEHPRDYHGRWTRGIGPHFRPVLEPEEGSKWQSREGETKMRYTGLWMKDIYRLNQNAEDSKPELVIGMKYGDELDVAPGTDTAPPMEVNGREIQASPGFVEAFDERALPSIQLWADDHEVPLQTVLDTMTDNAQRYFNDSRVCVMVDSPNLASILDEGVKNQFVTKTSNGSYKPGLRKDAESEMFGLPKTGVKAKERPIYGYVGDLDGSDGWGVSQYGDAALVLKDDVRSRATVTGMDSLDRRAIPEPMTDVTWRQSALAPDAGSSGYYAEGYRFGSAGHDIEQDLTDEEYASVASKPGRYQFKLGEVEPEAVPPLMDAAKINPEAMSSGYVEAQIFGGVQASDIEEVVFDRPQPSGLTDRLDALGIPWSRRYGGSKERKWSG